MNPYEIHAKDVGALEVEMGDDCPSATILGESYLLLPGSTSLNKPLRDGGFSQAYDFIFVMLVSQFDALNQSVNDLKDSLLNSQMQYLDIDYKVRSVDVLSGATLFRIGANSLNENA